MDQGMSRPVVSLKSLRPAKNLIGLGSLSALRGEIVIIPNEIWVAYPHEAGALRANELGAADETAGFLVTASVPDWQTLPLPEDTDFSELPDAIEKLGESGGLNVERPFPFLIEGAFANLALKVVDGRAFQGQTRLSLEELEVAAAKAKLAAVDGVLVGFFASQDQPEFLHPGTRLHVHAVLPAEELAGHVDRVDLARGTTVRIPAPAR
jgi:acetolactate decarboxylase